MKRVLGEVFSIHVALNELTHIKKRQGGVFFYIFFFQILHSGYISTPTILKSTPKSKRNTRKPKGARRTSTKTRLSSSLHHQKSDSHQLTQPAQPLKDLTELELVIFLGKQNRINQSTIDLIKEAEWDGQMLVRVNHTLKAVF